MYEIVASLLADLQTIGLLWDIAGVLVLGFPLAKRGRQAIARQTATYWDANPHAAREAVAARHDARYGTTVLVVRFLMQIAGQHIPDVAPMFGGMCLAALACVFAAYFWSRRDSRLSEKANEVIHDDQD